VAELEQILRRAVERSTGYVWVEGEVASLRRAGSGHTYFVLKDEREDAVFDCVLYRMQAQRARRWLEDGARLQIYGRATVWAPRGRLQLIGEAARPAGRGSLLAALEELKGKLHAEGLFDAERKRALPSAARVVGVVTSASGAAFHDIVTVAFRRARVKIVFSPAQVQGDGAALSIERALDRLERYPGLDAIIVGRGGGSGEDLMVFNNERLVRRVAALRVPVVSAVGHEIDTTLTDLVADVRAATPSQAAELVVPDESARMETLRRAAVHLSRSARSRLREDRAAIDRLRSKLSDPRFVIAEKQQYLDELMTRIERQITKRIARRRSSIEKLTPRLQARHPRAVLLRARGDLGPLTLRLRSLEQSRLERARSRLSQLSRELDSLSPLSVLGRGYAIATRADGRALRSSSDVAAGDSIELRLHSGRLHAVVAATDEG
jgi:exodeoxyribonuclease VII large subunit